MQMHRGEAAQKGTRSAALRRAGAFLGRHKVLVGLVIGAAALGVFGIARGLAGRGRTAAAGPAYDYVRTVTLARTTLRNTVTVTGTVTAGQTANVTADDTVRTYQVASVNVEVGDTVREGDVIATLDTASLQKQIETAWQSYQDDLQTAQTNYDRAVADHEIAAVQHENSLIDLGEEIARADEKLAEAQQEENEARAARDAAASQRSTYAAALQQAQAEVAAVQAAYDRELAAQEAALADLNSAVAAYNAAYATAQSEYAATGELPNPELLKTTAKEMLDKYDAYDGSGDTMQLTVESELNPFNILLEDYSPTGDEDNAVSRCEAARQALDSAQSGVYNASLGLTGLKAIESAAQTAENDLEMAENDLKQATTARESAEQQVNTAHDNYDREKNGTSVMTALQKVEDTKTRLEQARRTPENLTTLQEKLAKCTLTATMSGTVTALNAIVGSVSTGAVATIQDVDALVVEVTVPADDVPALTLGMPCNISSDATGDAVIQGMLTQIDPIANDKGSFNAKVRVNDSAAGLLVGVQAQVDIIENAANNVFTVPIDAVGTDENGGSYVLRSTGGTGVNMTFAQVPVTTGAANDYDIEISAPDLMEGDIIRASADLSEGIVSGEADAAASTMPSFPGGSGSSGRPGGNPFAPVG